jgi:hypothetical protein
LLKNQHLQERLVAQLTLTKELDRLLDLPINDEVHEMGEDLLRDVNEHQHKLPQKTVEGNETEMPENLENR